MNKNYRDLIGAVRMRHVEASVVAVAAFAEERKSPSESRQSRSPKSASLPAGTLAPRSIRSSGTR